LQINFKISFTFSSSLAKPDDFSTQRSNSRIIRLSMQRDP
jgi:hypothetical protein